MRIAYTVRATEADGHRGRFAIDLEEVGERTVDLVLPSWVPGSYRIVNYARGFRDLEARALSGGSPMPVERIDKARWRVRTGGAPAVHVEYTVYGHEMHDEAYDLTSEHVFVNAALCLPYVDRHLSEPVEVRMEVPSGWRVVTELEELGSEPPRYRAPNYDALVDNPIDAGRPVVVTIRPGGIPHRISICGEGGNYELRRVEADLEKIVNATVAMVGESPLRAYTFFYHLNDISDGGLEHAASTSCIVPRLSFAPAPDYERFLRLTSHEYFHLYNVKRIRPTVLGPFDYTREVYTRLLWWMEGTTEYFSELLLRRAGLLTPAKYFEGMAKRIQDFLETPGRRRQTLEDASFLAWTDYYQKFEETVNQSISYYVKGALVSLGLDLEIRHRTENRASLETVLRALWTEYGKVDRGLEEDELPRVAERATGLDLGASFEKYLRTTEEIDFEGIARFAGLAFGPAPKKPDDDSPVPGYLGIRYENASGLARVRQVLVGTPAREAGLSPGDEIVAFNRARATHESFEAMLKRHPPGTIVDLTIFRRGYLRAVSVTMGSPPPEKYVFTPVESPDDLARAVYESWIGEKWAPASAPPTTTK
jgi:predicted metalloprotease with PDZ domain